MVLVPKYTQNACQAQFYQIIIPSLDASFVCVIYFVDLRDQLTVRYELRNP
jgi:hypothetical protein